MTETPIPQPVADFIDIVNAHDDAGFLAALSPEATVDDWRSNHANGRSAFTFIALGHESTSMTIREG